MKRFLAILCAALMAASTLAGVRAFLPSRVVQTATGPIVVPGDKPPPGVIPVTPVSGMLPTKLFIDNRFIPKKIIGYATARRGPSPEAVNRNSDGNAWRTSCRTSHFSYDDPIVYPGQPGKTHLHVFFGNQNTSAVSTPESIISTGNSTCDGGILNRTAYWVPAMIDTATGKPQKPLGNGVYYKDGRVPDAWRVQIIAPPAGLRMIAGNPYSTVAQTDVIRYRCDDGPINNLIFWDNIPSSAQCQGKFTMMIFFPQCWDGVNLDSPDHASHMAYFNHTTEQCPDTHPEVLPEIVYNIQYQPATPGGQGTWRLSSDKPANDPSGFVPAGWTGHGDWFMGWSSVMDEVVANCLHNTVGHYTDCHDNNLNDGGASPYGTRLN